MPATFIRQGITHGAITPAVTTLDAEGAAIAILYPEQGAPGAAEVLVSSEREALPYGLAYSSPEQTGRMNRPIDHRTDLYSLGVVFYRLLTGHLPFEATDPLSMVHDHLATKPTPPAQIRPDLPLPISEIVDMLLAKDPRDRYQSADGLAGDLRICLARWQSTGRIEPFPLGQTDVSDRLLLPQALYGRESDLDQLLSAFGDACSGVTQLVLVSGDSGIGKTSLMGELTSPVSARGGMLIRCRADESHRQRASYGTVIDALEDFVHQLLANDPIEITAWRDKLTLALSGNTAQIVGRIPDLAQIIETPSDVPSDASDPKILLALALNSFIRAITEPDHPLVMVLDDAQWADAESWQLVRNLTTDSDLHLLVICAYREDQGADARIPEILASIPAGQRLALAPLDLVDTGRLLADALHSTPQQVGELASLIHDKTGGNVFFVREFLRSLYDQNLVFFDPKNRTWQWDLARIKAAPITGNVVELVRVRLEHLPEQTQKTLKVAAIMGSRVEVDHLAAACHQTPAETDQDLRWAFDLGAMVPIVASLRQPVSVDRPIEPRPAAMEQLASRYLETRVENRGIASQDRYRAEDAVIASMAAMQVSSPSAYAFAHERAREAARLLQPSVAEETIHWQIGRGLLQSMTRAQRQENCFVLARHLNQASALLEDWPDRVELAELNLQAGRQALVVVAYENALSLAMRGIDALHTDPRRNAWQDACDLMRDLHLIAAQAASRLGRFEQADRLFAAVDDHTTSVLDRAASAQARMLSHYLQGKHAEALAAALDALRQLGVRLPLHPHNRHVLAAIARTRLAMLGRLIP